MSPGGRGGITGNAERAPLQTPRVGGGHAATCNTLNPKPETLNPKQIDGLLLTAALNLSWLPRTGHALTPLTGAWEG